MNLNKELIELDLTVRTHNILRMLGYATLNDLLTCDIFELSIQVHKTIGYGVKRVISEIQDIESMYEAGQC